MTSGDHDRPEPPSAEALSTHPMLRGELVALRPAERSDIPLFVRWLSDAEVTRSLLIRAPLSIAMEEQWFAAMLEHQGRSDHHYVICTLADGRPIGTCGLHQVDLDNGSAAFGIQIGEPSEWGRGYGTDALRAICDFGFGELRLERVWLDVYQGNDRGRRSYEKAGFSAEGTLRHAHFTRGVFEDVIRMSLLRHEWLALDRPRSWELPGPGSAAPDLVGSQPAAAPGPNG
jgi:diamine N-acetyltransferase